MKHFFLLLLSALLLCSCEAKDLRQIFDHVDEWGTPAIGFTYTVSGLTVKFQNQSSSNVSRFFWDFGDGIQLDAVSPVHIYRAGGVYKVTLYGTITSTNKTVACYQMVKVP